MGQRTCRVPYYHVLTNSQDWYYIIILIYTPQTVCPTTSGWLTQNHGSVYWMLQNYPYFSNHLLLIPWLIKSTYTYDTDLHYLDALLAGRVMNATLTMTLYICIVIQFLFMNLLGEICYLGRKINPCRTIRVEYILYEDRDVAIQFPISHIKLSPVRQFANSFPA